MQYTVAALYQFSEISDPDSRRDQLLAICRARQLRGTFILATEGINGTVAGADEDVTAVIRHIESWPEISQLEVKYSYSDSQSFSRMKVKVKDEIVSMGRTDVDPRSDVGTYVEPEDWNELISRQDILVVDTRNSFEVNLGRFQGAVDPQTTNFRQFPEWADRIASEPNRPKAVAMYCTGGIRCEKATAYMRQLGFDDVFHLKGGILRYLEQTPKDQSLWEGECFVFDDRVSLEHGLVKGNHALCYGCQRPISPSDRQSPLFEDGVSCPACHDSLSEIDRGRYRERQRQITLAAARGTRHIRDDAASAAAQITS